MPPKKPAGQQHVFAIKDRSRFNGVVPGKSNMAVFIDADNVTADEIQRLDPVLTQIGGNVCLRRFFTLEERPGWTALRAARGYELFEVDSFMPVHIQLLADVAHVMDHRPENGATCACVVVPDAHGDPYLRAFPEEGDNGGWDWFVVTPKKGLVGRGTVRPLPGEQRQRPTTGTDASSPKR
jgi:hypothetical protein